MVEVTVGVGVKAAAVTVIIGLTALAVHGLFEPRSSDRRSGDEVVDVTVTFSPKLRTGRETVVISVAVNASEILRDRIKLSPWGPREFRVPRGAVVSVLATQDAGDALWCHVERPGVPHVTRGPAIGAGSVRCMT